MMKLTPENLQKNEDLKASAQKAKKAAGSGASEKAKAVESVVAAAAKEKKRRRESMLEKVSLDLG